jgi:hypothetical protein
VSPARSHYGAIREHREAKLAELKREAALPLDELERLEKAALAEIASDRSKRVCWLDWTVALHDHGSALIAAARERDALREKVAELEEGKEAAIVKARALDNYTEVCKQRNEELMVIEDLREKLAAAEHLLRERIADLEQSVRIGMAHMESARSAEQRAEELERQLSCACTGKSQYYATITATIRALSERFFEVEPKSCLKCGRGAAISKRGRFAPPCDCEYATQDRPAAPAEPVSCECPVRKALEQIQWGNEDVDPLSEPLSATIYNLCPMCDQSEARGHAPDCLVGMALSSPCSGPKGDAKP